MNLVHLEAILKHSETVFTFTLPDGSQLWSNGHIAFKAELALEGTDYPKLGKLWTDAQKDIAPAAAMIRDLVLDPPGYYRRLKSTVINEAFFRCFDGPGVTWSERGVLGMVSAHHGTELVGLVMPVKSVRVQTVPSASDAEVFEMFSSQCNDYYLMDAKELRRDIEATESQIEAAEETAERANAMVSTLEARLDGFKAKLEAIKQRRKAEDPQRQTDGPQASAGGK